jgi:hypothetical protein
MKARCQQDRIGKETGRNRDGSEKVKVSRYDLESEPLYHNNSIFPCWPEFSWERYTRLKNLATGSGT